MIWDAQLGNDGEGLMAEFRYKSAECIEELPGLRRYRSALRKLTTRRADRVLSGWYPVAAGVRVQPSANSCSIV